MKLISKFKVKFCTKVGLYVSYSLQTYDKVVFKIILGVAHELLCLFLN